MKISDIHTLYINLDKDVERLKTIESDLKKHNIKFDKVKAVYGKRLKEEEYCLKTAKYFNVKKEKMNIDYWLNRRNFKTMCKYENSVLAKVGCYLSHLKALKIALDMGLDKVLILEDDALITHDYEFEIPDNTDIFYLGGYWFKQKGYIPTCDNPCLINTKNLKVCGTYGYILPTRQKIKDAYNLYKSVFLDGKGKDKDENWREGEIRIRAETSDFHLINFFQKLGKCYIANPPAIYLRPYESNINDNRSRYVLNTQQ